ncbi:asparaginase [Alphaproteobacteria bacterium]|nr:asparaginase [Alphaproteobacteria bacterium]
MTAYEPENSVLSEPVLVRVDRQDLTESLHYGSAIIYHAQQGIIAAWGNPNKIIFPRSAMKPLQVFTALSSGLDLSDEQIAFGCASHHAEKMHINLAKNWLDALNLSSEEHLACGPALPQNQESLADILQNSSLKNPETHSFSKRIYHGCSGKHCCQLAFCHHNGWDIDGYYSPEHPAQHALFTQLESLSDAPLAKIAIDGCSLPAPAMTLAGFGRAMAQLANPEKLSLAEKKAAMRIFESTTKFPFLSGGTLAPNSQMTYKSNATFFAKNGSEGVYACIIPGSNCAVVLKMADGAMRAADTAIAGILHDYCKILKIDPAGATPFANHIMRNAAGSKIGNTYWVGEKFNL